MNVPAASSLSELHFLLLCFCMDKNLVVQSFTVSKVILVIMFSNEVLWFETVISVWVNNDTYFSLHSFYFVLFSTIIFCFVKYLKLSENGLLQWFSSWHGS